MRINYIKKFKGIYIYLKQVLKRDIYYSSVRPTSVMIFITYRCTSHCRMCTIWKRGINIDTGKADDMVRQGVLEPLTVLTQAIQSATNRLTATIL